MADTSHSVPDSNVQELWMSDSLLWLFHHHQSRPRGLRPISRLHQTGCLPVETLGKEQRTMLSVVNDCADSRRITRVSLPALFVQAYTKRRAEPPRIRAGIRSQIRGGGHYIGTDIGSCCSSCCHRPFFSSSRKTIPNASLSLLPINATAVDILLLQDMGLLPDLPNRQCRHLPNNRQRRRL